MYKNPICIYHGNCPDGFGSAWAIWNVYGSSFEYIPFLYGKQFDLDELCKKISDCDLFLTDFSFKKNVMLKLKECANSITLIDHHITAIEDLSDLDIEKSLDINKSGSVLTWEFFHKNEKVPLFLKYIQDRDLWKFELPNSKEITTALLSYEYDFHVWDKLYNKPIDTLILEGGALYRKHMKDVNELIKTTKTRVDLLEYNIPIANAPYCYASDICNIMAQGEPFAISYYIRNDGKINFSLRSNNETGVDVSEIAKQFGGGGHKHASGFEVYLENYNFVQEVINHGLITSNI